MSILKRILIEDIAPLFRKPRDGQPASRRFALGQSGGSTKPARKELLPVSPERGMTAVILNWKKGENDPFTVVNGTITNHLRACGKNVAIVEISENGWPSRLASLAREGVEFAFTWQGLGSPTTVGEHGESLWDHHQIPLICIHGDHPSHMPRNHQLESRYCFHLYANAEFARYSNRHFRRRRSASVIDIPLLHRETPLDRQTGDHFVVAKNIDDPVETEKAWREQLTKREFEAYIVAAETLKALLAHERYVDVHAVLDELVVTNNMDWLLQRENITAYHQYHSQLDRYLRSHKSVLAVTTLRDFPVQIYGRGWARIARSAPRLQTFHAGRDMADSQDLFYSRFGVLDVSPSKGLHDRTRRAMANGTGFLSSANLEDSFADLERFQSLFYNFIPGDLPNKCDAVVRDPEMHKDAARSFAQTYHTRFHFRDFVARIDSLAKLARPF